MTPGQYGTGIPVMMVKGFTTLPYQDGDSVQQLAVDKETTPFCFVAIHLHKFAIFMNHISVINVMQSHTLAVQDVFWSFHAALSATLG